MAQVTSSSNRNKRSTKRPVTKGQNPQRANRQKISKAKVTNSQQRSNRMRSSTAKVTQGSNGKPASSGTARVTTSASRDAGPTRAEANRWQQYQQSARTSGKGPMKGSPGTMGAPTNATPTGPRNPQSQIASARMRNTLRNSAAMRNAAKIAQTVGAIRGISPAVIAYETLKARPLADGTLKGKPTGAKQGPAVPKRLTQSGINKGSFDDAFRNARKAGKKEFSWRGKKYNTKLRGE
jgi:hypothetical protein